MANKRKQREGKIGIRFEDKTRKYWNIPYKWQRVNAKEIQHFIEAVHYQHIKKEIPIDEAVERVKARAPQDKLPKAKQDRKTNIRCLEEI